MPSPRLNPTEARAKLQAFRFADLFVEDLGWNLPATRKAIPLEHEGVKWSAREIAQLSGFRVFEIMPLDPDTPPPDARTQLALHKHVSLHSVENILIFLDAARTRCVWLWMKREEKKLVPRRHHYLSGQPGDLFLSKLASLVVDLSELDDEGKLDIIAAAKRVRDALDVEAVTKRFFNDFQEQHIKILGLIKGISDDRDRRWYASVLLNRLMFIWFLQEKLFLDGKHRTYLEDKLAECRKREGKDRFFRAFLGDLFFEGFAKPPQRRELKCKVPLGTIPYLNGGLFLPHSRLEQSFLDADQRPAKVLYPKLDVPDAAFDGLFALFRRYSWNLDDSPGGKDDEISPDVLGYIFEKYINQKDFGAYYTRPEMTGYLCEQTIHALVLDRIATSNSKSTVSNPQSLPDLISTADGPLCERLLHDILPRLTLLDPACGSGAFIVAALKTMLGLYTGVLGRAQVIQHRPLLDELDKERALHKHGGTETPLGYWLKKRIVTQNLYGVDLMEEAVEIAKLRLFLSLVASVETVEQLEPLPNIEFNLLAGNSLLGLLHIDADSYDGSNLKSTSQQRMVLEHAPAADELGFITVTTVAPTTREKTGAFVAQQRASRFREILADKNKSIALYKAHAFEKGELEGLTQDERLLTLRSHIENLHLESYARLNELLLRDFQHLGIQFEQATWDAKKNKEGKPEKRKLTLADLATSRPFHWAYEFDHILAPVSEGGHGGFDAIITNPPWENFKPDAKEFFEDHSELVTKNKMRLEDFEEEKTRLLNDEEIRDAWLAYQSGFRHLNLWFRNAAQYSNQTAIINGRKATTDLNLYKLFTEQCFNLLRDGGRCGIIDKAGVYADLGATGIRRLLLEQCEINEILGFSNERNLFEGVHHAERFAIVTFKKGGTTREFTAVFRINVREAVKPAELDAFLDNMENRVVFTSELIAKLSPDSLSIPEFNSKEEVRIASKLAQQTMLGDQLDGIWNLTLQREFHMTDDAALYHPKQSKGMVPLVEGKTFHQFTFPFGEFRYWLKPEDARKPLLSTRRKALRQLCETHEIKDNVTDDALLLDCQSHRLAFRDVASSTNERTMIATILPKNVFCPHTVSMEVVFHDEVRAKKLHLNQTALTHAQRLYLCAVFNSFVVDYQLRSKVTSHLSFYFIHQLPIPRLTEKDAAFRPLVERAARLVGTSAAYDDLLKEVFGKKATHQTHGITDPAARQTLRAEIDALVARLYDLTEDEFTHILSTFPLVAESVKSETLNTFRAATKGEIP